MENIRQIAIVGTGLLGGSIGLGLRKAGFSGRIVGVGRRRVTLDQTIKMGCVDAVTQDVTQAAKEADLVILAAPLGTFEPLMKQLAAADHDGLVMTDVGSTKQQVMQQAASLLPKPGRFVGSHPMAGGEMHGPTHAQADLFQGRPCIVVADGCDSQATETVEQLWRMLGMRVLRMSAADHDRQTAAISHWPHAVAALLVQLAEQSGGLDIASTGFADVTRIASGDPQVWADIFSTNRESVLTAIEQYEQLMGEFKQALQQGSREDLLKILECAKTARDQWKRGNDASDS